MSHDGKRSVACDALGGGIYLSHDFGESWEMAKVPGNNWYAVTSSWDGRVLVAVAGGSDYDDPGPVYSSVDWGDTWQKIPGPARAWYAAAENGDGTDFYAAVLGGAIYQGQPIKIP